MEKKYLSYVNYREYKEYNPSNTLFENVEHMESKLYSKEDILLKLLYPEVISQNRLNTLNSLDRINHKDCTKIYDLIESFDGRIGYTMEKYNYYKTLKYYVKRLNKRNTPLSERKKLIRRINDIFEYFLSIGFLYYDVHLNNIIMLDDSIKVVDLDSGIFEDNAFFAPNSYHKTAEKYKVEMLNSMAYTYLQILLGTSINLKREILVNGYASKIARLLDEKGSDLFKHALYIDETISNPIDSVESMKEESIDEIRKIILK